MWTGYYITRFLHIPLHNPHFRMQRSFVRALEQSTPVEEHQGKSSLQMSVSIN